MIKNLAIGGGSNRLLLMFALLLGLVSAILVGVYLSGLNSSDDGGPASSATVPVVVAAQNIPASTAITAEMVTLKSVPVDVVLPDVFRTAEAVVGQTTQVGIVAGEQILPAKVTSADSAVSQFGADTPVSLVIPDGMRAVAVFVSDVATAGGLVRSGDRVDLIYPRDGTTSNEEGQEVQIFSACYVLQDVQVLAVGTSLAAPDAESSSSGLAGGSTTSGQSTMTVAVTPADASLLAAAQGTPSNGSVGSTLWASLRPFGERGPVEGLETCQVTVPPAPAS